MGHKRTYPFFLVYFFFLIFFLGNHSLVFAQDSIAIGYSERIQTSEIRNYLSVLTSDSLMGRETGKPGQKKAADFISKHFASLGLKPISHETFMQDFPVTLLANQGMNIEVNQQYFLFMRDYYYKSGYLDTLIVFDTIIFTGYGISEPSYDDYDNLNVSGKAILFYNGEPKNKKNVENKGAVVDWKKKLAIINSKKPSMVFVICDPLDEMIDSLNYSENNNQRRSSSEIPIIYITPEMALKFFPELSEDLLEKAKAKIDKKGKPQSFVISTLAFVNLVNNTNKMKGQNVAGFLEGTDKKDEVLVITAHYDHLGSRDSLIYRGADDNGSGTSSVMELAKVFSEAKAEGHSPRRSILFMTVSGEEKGIIGSAYYVKHPLVPLEKTIVNLNADMIGRTDDKHDTLGIHDYIYIIGSDKLSTELHQINENANATHTKLTLDYSFNNPGEPQRLYYRSDHYNFAKNNIPVIFYFDGIHKDYHKTSDTIDKIDFGLLKKRIQLVFFTAWELANRESKIKVNVKNDFDKEEMR